VGGSIDMRAADGGRLPAARHAYVRDCHYRQLRTAYEHILDPQPHEPWPRHYHHTGASFALTAVAYARAGGLPPLSGGEDVALYNALVRNDASVRHSPLVRVTTSGHMFKGSNPPFLGCDNMTTDAVKALQTLEVSHRMQEVFTALSHQDELAPVCDGLRIIYPDTHGSREIGRFEVNTRTFFSRGLKFVV
jgi:hypothetical protein